jgi:hypothetical protein
MYPRIPCELVADPLGTSFRLSKNITLKLYALCILYIGQTYRSSPQYSFYIFSQQIYLIIFF